MATKDFGQNHETMRVWLKEQAQLTRVGPDEDNVHSSFAQEDGGYVPARYANHMVLEIPYFQSDPGTRNDNVRPTPLFNYMRIDAFTSQTVEGEARIPEGVESCKLSLISCTIFGSSCNPADVLRCLFRDHYVPGQYDSPLNDLRRLMNLTIRNVRVMTSLPTTPARRRPGVLQMRDFGVRETNQARVSNTSSVGSFVSARSQMSFISPRSSHGNSAFFSARGSGSTTLIRTIREDESPSSDLSAPLARLHGDYYTTLHQQDIIQPFDKELNWSGKGQHVTFADCDAIPLSTISVLGASMSATVDKVVCRRIALARKTMRCNRRWTVADALREVYHLQNLRHFHIIQLVGTYLQGRDFSILMYPAADTHLGRFLEDTMDIDDQICSGRRGFLVSTLGCLTSAVVFIHQHTTKHMDIKPQNILIKDTRPGIVNSDWRVYIADFGLSRSFASQDHSQTDGPTSRTPKYCAPEVYNFEERGRSADIFSLGCVFLEILTVIRYIDLNKFAAFRRGDSDDESYHANLERVFAWADSMLKTVPPVQRRNFEIINGSELEEVTTTVTTMIIREPFMRPTAVGVLKRLEAALFASSYFNRKCCNSPPEPYEAYKVSNVQRD